MSSVAEQTRDAVRARPFLHEALRAGVVNYQAAAELLDLGADEGTVAAALRRYAADMSRRPRESRRVRVTVRRNVAVAETGEDGLCGVGDASVVDGGDATAFVATGDVDGASLVTVLARLDVEGVSVLAAAVAADGLVVVVDAGTRTLAVVEDALEAVPRPQR
jgi:hypothetical protein